jgi:multisubunit Na+/H+ antiporter MnhF subunit
MRSDRVCNPCSTDILQPIYLLVAVAYATFFISRLAVPARMSMCVICFLTLRGLSVGTLAMLPIISTSVWLLDMIYISSIFVFVSIIEFSFAHYLTRSEQRLLPVIEACRRKQAEHAAECSQPPDTELPHMDEHSNSSVHSRVQVDRVDIMTDATSTQNEQLEKQVVVAHRASLSLHTIGNVAARAKHSVVTLGKTKQNMMARHEATRLDRLFINSDGTGMRIQDQHIDTACRWLFPIAYCAIMFFMEVEVAPHRSSLATETMTSNVPQCQVVAQAQW